MIGALIAIARNTFVEVLRLPAFGLVVLFTLATLALHPFLVMFSFRHEANQLLMDFGVSTLLLSTWVLVCLSASNVVRREIEERTTLVLLSKPVSRELFLVAKWIGVLAAMALVLFLFALALMLAARQEPAVHAHHPTDWPVVAGGVGGFLLALAAAAVRNYITGRPFSSSVIGMLTVTLTAGFCLAACFDRAWHLQPFGAGFHLLIARASLVSFFAIAILASFAVSISVWIGRGGTFVLTALLFLAGLWVVALPEGWRLVLFFLPDFQVFWVGEVFYQKDPALPASYIALTGLYATAYAVAYLALGAWAFRRRAL